MRERQDLTWVLVDLCKRLGYCGASRESERAKFLAQPPVDVDEFLDRVLVAEGWDEPALMEGAQRRALWEFIAERWDGTA